MSLNKYNVTDLDGDALSYLLNVSLCLEPRLYTEDERSSPFWDPKLLGTWVISPTGAPEPMPPYTDPAWFIHEMSAGRIKVTHAYSGAGKTILTITPVLSPGVSAVGLSVEANAGSAEMLRTAAQIYVMNSLDGILCLPDELEPDRADSEEPASPAEVYRLVSWSVFRRNDFKPYVLQTVSNPADFQPLTPEQLEKPVVIVRSRQDVDLPEPLDLGIILMTPGVFAASTDPEVLQWIQCCIIRHSLHDWGDVCDEDWDANDADAAAGRRTLSVNSNYGMTIWIISEPGNETTTVMLPEEY